jgi:hypothetical protein
LRSVRRRSCGSSRRGAQRSAPSHRSQSARRQ